jgi:serine/threonine protein kinase
VNVGKIIARMRELMINGQEIQHFGNYDLVRRIAVGGMGEVYLARQRTAFGREVAVKIIRSDLVHDITARQRFLREAEVNAYLKHDHILPLVEFGEEQGRLFLVTPYIKGDTLLKRLQTGPLSLAEVHQLFTALVKAVAYLHKRGVIHRDLKPSNILLDREEDSNRIYVRLIDFGIATLQGLPASASLTTGHEIGTVAYMAPERLDGMAAPSNDIYSLGVILYQMITRQLPMADKMVALPAPLDYVIEHCILPNPKERFASADDLLAAFEQAYHIVKTVCDVNNPFAAPNNFPSPSTINPAAPTAISGPLLTRDFTPPSFFDSATVVQPDSHTIQEEPLLPYQRAKLANADHLAAMPQPDVVLPPLPRKQTVFTGEDYSAPTLSLDPAQLGRDKPVIARRTPLASTKSAKRNRSIIAPTITLVMVILLVMGALGYQAFQASILATITISPRTQPVSKVFTLTAKLGLNKIDVASSSIPASVFTNIQTDSQQGETTGQTNCTLGIFDCQQSVSSDDIEELSSQMEPKLRAKIQQDLQKQVQAANAIKVGSTRYSNETVTPNPLVNTVSPTVKVTLTEQGSTEYVKVQDIDDLAVSRLKQELNQHYQLIDSSTRIGQPVIEQVNPDHSVQIKIAAGGRARYQMPASELANIQNQIKGLTQKDARAQIAKDPNIDPKSIIGISISYGNTVPNNVQQIKVVIVINPSNLPPVELTPIV